MAITVEGASPLVYIFWTLFFVHLGTISIFTFYYLFFAFVYLLVPKKNVPRVPPRRRFLIVIPAHNEEYLIGRTLKELSVVNYPRPLFEVVVIADNCNDRTAAIAAEHSVLVVERQDSQARGKGYALSWALRRLPLSRFDAVVIIDADTIMDRQYLQEMNAALCAGHSVLQGYNNLLNPTDSCLTRLIHVTSVMKNLLFNEGKRRLNLSVALMGTGMCFERKVLEEMGWGAHSIGEDWEYFAKLTERGIAVTFLDRAVTYAHEATSLRQGFSQRLRWAGGKFQMMRQYGFPIFWQGLWQFNIFKVDAALNLLSPPFSQLAYLNVFAVGVAFVGPMAGSWPMAKAISIFLFGLQVIYFILGLIAMKASAKTALSVVLSPIFLCWKIVVDFLALIGYQRRSWVRTARNVRG
jgi:cellulose synthase/poly-beta-1,6-N-acetylglucosamine synthase-like glycosyltransferase